MSTVSVYARNDEPGADETADVVEPTDLSKYADAKVAAERSSAARLGSRLLIGRPGLIVGPGDPSDRFGYWPARLSGTGPVLTPTTSGRFVQVIDVADLAAWIGQAARAGHSGVVNAVGESVALADFLRTMASVTGFNGELVEVEDSELLAHDVRYWAGRDPSRCGFHYRMPPSRSGRRAPSHAREVGYGRWEQRRARCSRTSALAVSIGSAAQVSAPPRRAVLRQVRRRTSR